MKALIDSDVLRMEIGSVGQFINEDGVLEMRSWDFVQELLDAKIREICELVWADEYVLFLTSCRRTHRILHRRGTVEYKPNFREAIAVTKPYKGTRKGDKPLHYDNITAYMINCHPCVVAEGCEADDLLSITQTDALRNGEETIICTRDKDLRMVEGNHFGWLCGKQPQYGPKYVSRDEGDKFFCTQLLTGDTVDNIPGLKGVGPVKAEKLLEGKSTYEEMLEAVRDAYKGVYGDDWPDVLIEQGQLLYMSRKRYGNGQVLKWRLPDFLLKENEDVCSNNILSEGLDS